MNWGDTFQVLSIWVAGSVTLAALWVGTCIIVRRRRVIDRWRARALIAEANVDHALCHATETAMANFIAYQERELDAYRAGKDVGDEAEDWLKADGS